MSNAVWDEDAWQLYPQHRWVFNKLELALRLGYSAGPAGVPVPQDGYYIVRPTYNISGMGLGARREYIRTHDYVTVKPGEFWCEVFEGPQITVDYAWTHLHPYKPEAVFAARGYRTSSAFYRFNAWRRVDPPKHHTPMWFDQFFDVPQFNVEYIGDKIIEIHLRSGIDFPAGSVEIIPVWSDSAEEQHRFMKSRPGWKWQPNHDDADGHMSIYRTGFYYR